MVGMYFIHVFLGGGNAAIASQMEGQIEKT